MRNQDLVGNLRWTRRRRTEGIQPCGLMWAATPAAPWPNKKSARRLSPWHGDHPRAPNTDKQCRLPQECTPGTLSDAMRVTPCGDGGLAASLFQGIAASLSFCLSSFVGDEASAAPCTKGNKKAQSHHTHVALGNGRLRFSRQCSSSLTSIRVRASCTAYFVLSRTLHLGRYPTLVCGQCQ
jgi:hypothetical protein